MSLVVRIEQSQSWRVRSLAGAWRRIVMNLLGNALKWTKSGFVEVSLSVARPEEPQSFIAHLSITDTGSGIAPDFLRHKLFSPFAQEDSLTEGVGLGLSIVRQLVTSLNGTVNVRSELGIGTQVDVYIPVQDPDGSIPPQLLLEKHVTCIDGVNVPLQVCLVAFNGYPDLNEVPTGLLSVDAKRRISIQSTLADVFMSYFGWSVSLAESLEEAQGDIVVFEEPVLKAAAEGSSCLDIIKTMEAKFKYFVVLGSKMQNIFGPNVIWVTQPYVEILSSDRVFANNHTGLVHRKFKLLCREHWSFMKHQWSLNPFLLLLQGLPLPCKTRYRLLQIRLPLTMKGRLRLKPLLR